MAIGEGSIIHSRTTIRSPVVIGDHCKISPTLSSVLHEHRRQHRAPETLEIGANRLVGTNPATIVEGVREMLEVKPDWANPYGNGHAAKRIHQIISSKYLTK